MSAAARIEYQTYGNVERFRADMSHAAFVRRSDEQCGGGCRVSDDHLNA